MGKHVQGTRVTQKPLEIHLGIKKANWVSKNEAWVSKRVKKSDFDQ
jgi:hypothetical protein